MHVHTMKAFNKKIIKGTEGKYGFINVFIFNFLQTFGMLKNHSANISKDYCVSTADID